MKGINTSAAEVFNSYIGRHRYVIRQMSKLTRGFVLQEMVETRNTCLVKSRTAVSR